MSSIDFGDPLLVFAAELERRDGELASALEAVERVQGDVDELRTVAAANVAFVSSFPETAAAYAAEEQAARAAQEAAEAAVRDADARLETASDDARLAAGRAVREARESFEAAARWVETATAAAARLGREAEERRAEAGRLEARALELSGAAHGVARPGPGLGDIVDWASTARGALLLQRAALAAEREQIVREANELLGSALGEPLAATAVTGLRAKLERALRKA
jgi:hypothetical protein